MRNLDSPLSARLFETYETKKYIVLVLEYLEGGELPIPIKSEVIWSQEQLRLLMRNLILALRYVHENRIMHRDIKPENILMRGDPKDCDLVLIDYGLAEFTDKNYMILEKCGTPGFIAPEIFIFDEDYGGYGSKCDIFSAGVIFYLLLTGEFLFEGKNGREVLKNNKTCRINFKSLQD